MELTYNELKKREVINVNDGRSLGKIIDIRFDFPEGVIIGIYVPGRRLSGIFRIFDKSTVYIDQSKIIKIGGDVILVDLKCGEVCSPSVKRKTPPPQNQCPPPRPPKCPPQCPPQCPPPCPPQCGNNYLHGKGQNSCGNDTSIFGANIISDEEDY